MSWSETSIEKYHDVSHDTYDSPKVNLVHQMKVAVLSMFCQGILKNSRSNRSFCYLILGPGQQRLFPSLFPSLFLYVAWQ
jgi:hypothetical protein